MGSYEQIWAPWRLAYIQGEKPDKPVEATPLQLAPGADAECFLCQAVADPQKPDRFVVRRSDHCLTVLNRYPYNNGHLLVAPLRHLDRLEKLSAEEQLAVSQEVSQMVLLLERVIHPEGFNIGLNLGRIAGAGSARASSLAYRPRWEGDTNFMPALAAVKIIPQSLETLAELLRERLAAHPC